MGLTWRGSLLMMTFLVNTAVKGAPVDQESSQSVHADCNALISFYKKTGGPHWKSPWDESQFEDPFDFLKNTNQTQTARCCLWHGITCEKGNVVAM